MRANKVTATFNVIFLFIYVLSAAVQFNDPDALPWVVVYLAATYMCIAQFLHTNPTIWLPRTLLVVCVLWSIALLPSIVGQVSIEDIIESISMKTKAVEEAREIGGLLLIVLWASVLSFRQRDR